MLTKYGWYPVSQNGSHVKLKHNKKSGIIIFPNHGSLEVGKGLERKTLKDAGLKLENKKGNGDKNNEQKD
ncbi:MAG: type II toxin-antitoxin system HicA family toxin [Bacteroidales bacterium]|nr:type II toxin-antitoxin system HicA family toxin [Bacteroidales bacterium]